MANSCKPNFSNRVLPTQSSDYVVVVDGELIEPNFLHTTYNSLLDVAENHLAYLFAQKRSTKKHIPSVDVSELFDDLRYNAACASNDFYQFQVKDPRLNAYPSLVISQLQKNALLWNGNWIREGIKDWNARAGKSNRPTLP